MRKCRLANTSSMPGGHHTDTFCDSIFLHPTNHDSTPMEPRIHEVIEPRIRTSEHRENEQRTRAVQLRPEGRLQGKGHFVARNQARLGRRSFHAGQVDLRKKMVQRLGNEGFLGLRVQHPGVLGWAEPFGAVLSCWRLAGCTRRPRAQRKAKWKRAVLTGVQGTWATTRGTRRCTVLQARRIRLLQQVEGEKCHRQGLAGSLDECSTGGNRRINCSKVGP